MASIVCPVRAYAVLYLVRLVPRLYVIVVAPSLVAAARGMDKRVEGVCYVLVNP